MKPKCDICTWAANAVHTINERDATIASLTAERDAAVADVEEDKANAAHYREEAKKWAIACKAAQAELAALRAVVPGTL